MPGLGQPKTCLLGHFAGKWPQRPAFMYPSLQCCNTSLDGKYSKTPGLQAGYG